MQVISPPNLTEGAHVVVILGDSAKIPQYCMLLLSVS